MLKAYQLPPPRRSFNWGTDVSDYVLLQSQTTIYQLLQISFFSDNSANLSVSPGALLIMGCFLPPQSQIPSHISVITRIVITAIVITVKFMTLLSWLWPDDNHRL